MKKKQFMVVCLTGVMLTGVGTNLIGSEASEATKPSVGQGVDAQARTNSDAPEELTLAQKMMEAGENPHSWRYNDEFYGIASMSEDAMYADLFSAAQSVDGAWQWNGSNYINSEGNRIPNVVMRGIDVSRWQGTIDWDTVAESGDIDFVIIRSVHGKVLDVNWETNADACTQRNIAFGSYVYCLATTEEEAVAEANRALELLSGYNLTLPVYYDMEDNSVLTALQQRCSSREEVSAELAKIATAFSKTIEEAGFKVGIYANVNWWTNYLTNLAFDTSGWHKWIACWGPSITKMTVKDENYVWQCTSKGNVAGITENTVDIDFVIDTALENKEIFEKRIPHMTGAEYQKDQKQVTVTWTDVLNEEKYYVYRKTSGGSWKRIQTLPANTTSYVDTNVEGGMTYFYTVRAARTCNGAEAKSGYEKEGCQCTIALDNPTLNEAYGMADGSTLVSWEAVDGANQYYVYRKKSGESWKRIAETAGTQYHDTDSTLQEGVTYIYTVRAYRTQTKRLSGYNKAGVSAKVQRVVPTLKSASASTGASITVSWNGVSEATKYRVYRKTGEGGWTRMAELSSASTSWRDTSAAYGNTYTYTVRAYCVHDGVGAWSSYNKTGISAKSTVDTTTLREAYPMVDGSILVSWGKVTDADQYYVYRKTTGGAWKRIAEVTDTKYHDKTADVGTKYIYTVRAYDENTKQLGGYNKNGVSATAKKSAPKLISTNTVEGSVTFAWQAMSEATKYRVYRKEEGGKWEPLGEVSADTTSWKDTAVQTGEKYYYTVRAYCKHNGVTVLSSHVSPGVSAVGK